jgi:hypothetical protein
MCKEIEIYYFFCIFVCKGIDRSRFVYIVANGLDKVNYSRANEFVRFKAAD